MFRPRAEHVVEAAGAASLAALVRHLFLSPFFAGGKEWWTRLQPIRTVGEMTARIPIKPTQQVPLYQRISRKVSQLHLLGMSYKQIGQALNVSPSLARKAYGFGRKKP